MRLKIYLVSSNQGKQKFSLMKQLTFKYHRNENIQRKLIERHLISKGVKIEFTPEIEHIHPDEAFEDKKDVDYILRKWETNTASWFCAKVTVKYRGFSVDEYLGCCSYESFEDFTRYQDCYPDMIANCIEQINAEIETLNERIQKAWDLRRKYINLYKQPRKAPLTLEQKTLNEQIETVQKALEFNLSDTGFTVEYSEIDCSTHDCGSSIETPWTIDDRRWYKRYVDYENRIIYWCFV